MVTTVSTEANAMLRAKLELRIAEDGSADQMGAPAAARRRRTPAAAPLTRRRAPQRSRRSTP
jgi:hypothetical protein